MMPFLLRGLGDATPAQLAQSSISAAGTASSVGLAIAGDTAMIPIVGPIAAGVSLLVGWFLNRNAKYHAQESATTKDANQIEQAMQANLAAFQSGQIDKATALANYQALWEELVQACQNPQLGTPGQRCISDRQAGACVIKNDGHGGPAGSGDVCWNWQTGYEQPIIDAPDASLTVGGMSFSPWLLAAIGGGLLLAGSQN